MNIKRPQNLNLRFILPLAMLYMTIYLTADSVAYKMVGFYNLILPGPPFIFPLTYAIGAIISEVYGSGISKIIIWLTLGYQFFYAIAITFILHLPSPPFWGFQSQYNIVFGNIIQFVSTGTFAVLSSSVVNIYLMAKIKLLFSGKHFWLRYLISTSAGGFILIFMIVVFAYYPALGYQKSITMFMSIYLCEIFYSIILVAPAWVVCGLLKKMENLDVFDEHIKFNPFIFNYNKEG